MELVLIFFPFLLVLGGLLSLPFFFIYLTKREKLFDPNFRKAKAYYPNSYSLRTKARARANLLSLPVFIATTITIYIIKQNIEALLFAFLASLLLWFLPGFKQTISANHWLLKQLIIYLVLSTLIAALFLELQYHSFLAFIVIIISGALFGIRLHYHVVLHYYYENHKEVETNDKPNNP